MGQIDRQSWIYQFPGPAIGKTFTGNRELAESYLGVGMAMLFYVKTTMKNGLLGSLSLNRTLPDGTTIQVSSFYGQDRIMIDAPFQPAPAKRAGIFQFKITRDDGLVMDDDPAVNERFYFQIDRPDYSETWFGNYPNNPEDTLDISFDAGSKVWTLQPREEDSNGVLQVSEFDPEDSFFVRYEFFGSNYLNKAAVVNNEWFGSLQTQYPFRYKSADMGQNGDLITPDFYADHIPYVHTRIDYSPAVQHITSWLPTMQSPKFNVGLVAFTYSGGKTLAFSTQYTKTYQVESSVPYSVGSFIRKDLVFSSNFSGHYWGAHIPYCDSPEVGTDETFGKSWDLVRLVGMGIDVKAKYDGVPAAVQTTQDFEANMGSLQPHVFTISSLLSGTLAGSCAVHYPPPETMNNPRTFMYILANVEPEMVYSV